MLAFIVAASLILALLITFLNGMNDAADAVSCIITTRVLTPLKAVAWAAFWGFMAYFIFNSHVAETMSRGLVEAQYMNPYVVFCALIGATAWIGISVRRRVSGIVIHDIDTCDRNGVRIFPSMSYHENMQEFQQEKSG